MGKSTIESLTGLIVQNVDTVHGSRISQLHDEGALPMATVVQVLSSLPAVLTDPRGMSYEEVMQLAAKTATTFTEPAEGQWE